MNMMKQLSPQDYNIPIIEDLGMQGTTPNRVRLAIFECPTCKKHFKANTAQIKTGTKRGFDNNCKSCSNKKKATTHGDSGTPLHKKWLKMLARVSQECYKEHYSDINVCSEWKDYLTFKEWALFNGYEDYLELDRIDTTKGYEASNCRWATRTIQTQNTSKRKDNTTGYRGVSKLRDKYRARITVEGKVIYLGVFNTAVEAGKAFDDYVIENKLEHNINGVGQLSSFLKDK